MENNKFTTILKVINILPGEEFHIKGRQETFKFTETSFLKAQYKEKGNLRNLDFKEIEEEELKDLIYSLITKNAQIIDERFNPKIGSSFYSYNSKWAVAWYQLDGYNFEYFVRYALGMVFRTKEQALLKREYYFKLLTGLEFKVENHKVVYPENWKPNPFLNIENIFQQDNIPKPAAVKATIKPQTDDEANTNNTNNEKTIKNQESPTKEEGQETTAEKKEEPISNTTKGQSQISVLEATMPLPEENFFNNEFEEVDVTDDSDVTENDEE